MATQIDDRSSCRNFRSSHSAAGAFTLVELLVVIGIIALLIAILLPSLAMARRQAQMTACAAKLHSIMVAAQLHLNDHHDYYPLAGIIPGTTPEMLDDIYSPMKYDYFSLTDGSDGAIRQLCPITTSLETEMAGHADLFQGNGIMNVSGEAGRETVMLDPHGLTALFVCPAQAASPLDIQPQFVFMYASVAPGTTSLMEPQSYIFNEYICGWQDYIDPTDPTTKVGHLRGKASLVHRPAQTMFAADGLGGNTKNPHSGYSLPRGVYTVYNLTTTVPVSLGDAFNADPNNSAAVAGDNANFDSKRHRNRLNVAFCDGHVENLGMPAPKLILSGAYEHSDLDRAWITAP